MRRIADCGELQRLYVRSDQLLLSCRASADEGSDVGYRASHHHLDLRNQCWHYGRMHALSGTHDAERYFKTRPYLQQSQDQACGTQSTPEEGQPRSYIRRA